MPRCMSFKHTLPQILSRTKTVTRRKGWQTLKPGDLFWAVNKVRGLKAGEKAEVLALLRCVSNSRRQLRHIGRPDVVREGFPMMSRVEFIQFFCANMGGDPDQYVQRIEFEYIDEADYERALAEEAKRKQAEKRKGGRR